MAKIRIGTRGSKLAMWQAEWVSGQLTQRGHKIELAIIATQGDISSASLSQVGGQGLFTKEIQRELLRGHVDLAVHSLKDLPTVPIEGLTLAAVPERETTQDCLLSRHGLSFEELPSGATVGTGSSRRAAQLLAWRPDIIIKDIRGNVDSRIRKMAEGHYEAIVLAAAGLTRLKLNSHITQLLPQTRILPAIGQGALGLECRSDDQTTREVLEHLSHADSFAAVIAERSLLSSLSAGCMAPVAALAQVNAANQLELTAAVFSSDGQQAIRGAQSSAMEHAAELGQQLARELIKQGADELIAAARR